MISASAGVHLRRGDNRADSRFFGPVPYDHIVGEAFLRVWPLNELGLV